MKKTEAMERDRFDIFQDIMDYYRENKDDFVEELEELDDHYRRIGKGEFIPDGRVFPMCAMADIMQDDFDYAVQCLAGGRDEDTVDSEEKPGFNWMRPYFTDDGEGHFISLGSKDGAYDYFFDDDDLLALFCATVIADDCNGPSEVLQDLISDLRDMMCKDNIRMDDWNAIRDWAWYGW